MFKLSVFMAVVNDLSNNKSEILMLSCDKSVNINPYFLIPRH